MTWLTDNNGNRCSVECWGSKKAAQVALNSLKGCSDCSDCSRCSDCSGCSRCSDLSDASPTTDHPARTHVAIPCVEDLHRKIYAAVSQPQALDMSTWHTCETTHCRAGWVIALAGEAGKALEEFFDTPLAAMKIYDASCPDYRINPARFHDSNKAAMEDMRKLAIPAEAPEAVHG